MSDVIEVTVENIEVTIGDSAPIIVSISGGMGLTGPVGPGVPAGGEQGQHLIKTSSAPYATQWADIPPSPPAGGDRQIQYNDAGTPAGDPLLVWDKLTKTLKVGVVGDVSLPNNPISSEGDVDTYLQINIRNASDGGPASSDYVATADNGDDLTNWVDMGIGSSKYDDPDNYPGYLPNEAYLQCEAPGLVIGTGRAGAPVKLMIGGTATENIVATITESGISMREGTTITNRPEIYYGTGDAPTVSGLLDGTLYIKYLN
jgi:hypothetical protein